MEEAALDIFLPVMESAVVIAAHYAKECGRDVVLGKDMHMGMMFAARNITGKHVGTLFPEVYDAYSSEAGSEGSDSESDQGSSSAEADECESLWTRYEGTDPELIQVNECADTWDAWEPDTPAERALKAAVEKARNS